MKNGLGQGLCSLDLVFLGLSNGMKEGKQGNHPRRFDFSLFYRQSLLNQNYCGLWFYY